MFAFYLTHGHSKEELENLTYKERLFYIAAMNDYQEQEEAKMLLSNPFLEKK